MSSLHVFLCPMVMKARALTSPEFFGVRGPAVKFSEIQTDFVGGPSKITRAHPDIPGIK